MKQVEAMVNFALSLPILSIPSANLIFLSCLLTVCRHSLSRQH